VFGDEPGRAYHARITKEFSRNNKNPRLRGQEFTITFDCEPFRYQATPAKPFNLPTSGNVINPGTAASAPLVYIEGTGDGTLMIGGNTLIFNNLSGHIYVDCDAKIAYMGDGTTSSPIVLATQYVTGEWMSIEPGNNAVQYTGGIRKVILTPRWRWL
jgi:phage-related protein